jgi:hypothetical protein
MTPKPLTDDERRAAAELGRGATQEAAAATIGKSTAAVRRLLKRGDFAALVEAAKEAGQGDEQKASKQTPREVLEEMLTATNRNGEPNKPLRMQAAIALSKLPDDASTERVIERVYVTPDHPDHDQIIDILDATPPSESVGVVDSNDDFNVLAHRYVPDPQAAKIHVLSGPSSPSTGDAPASPGDTPTDAERP